MNRLHRIQQAITLGALLVALAHILWPKILIDQITVALCVIAVIPWLGSLFKKMELPGGMKFEFADRLEKAGEQAKQAGLLQSTATGAPSASAPDPAYFFETADQSDPNLVLAALRVDLERRLKKLAEIHDVDVAYPGIVALVSALRHEGVFTMNEAIALRDLVRLLNEAVHGATVDQSAAQWAKEIGRRLLKTLDQRIADPTELGDPD
jgi:hypothetical protein